MRPALGKGSLAVQDRAIVVTPTFDITINGYEFYIDNEGLAVTLDSGRVYSVKGQHAGHPFATFPTAWFDQSPFSLPSSGTFAITANTLVLSPLVVPCNYTIDRLSAEITTATATNYQNLLYDSDGANSLPGTRLYQSANVSSNIVGISPTVLSPTITLKGGHLYWIGIHSQASSTVRSLNANAHRIIGVNAAGAYLISIRTNVFTFGSLPAVLNLTLADRSSNTGTPRMYCRSI